ncbi:MAG: hypothetical protein EA369_04830 [Bradymonadales bacterium]|nr:MAG: hypothetical protein EA369_04830 [Bradymonadales bacterium]
MRYKTPAAFLSALDQNLRAISEKEGIDVPRLRKQMIASLSIQSRQVDPQLYSHAAPVPKSEIRLES